MIGSKFQIGDAVIAAIKLARDEFDTFAAMGAGELPADLTNAMQVQLYRWQEARFGLQPDERIALGVIEEMGETFDAADAEHALDGLGDTCVYVGQILIANRLAIAPVLDLARMMAAAGGDIVPAAATGKLAHTVLKGSQKIRGLGDPEVYRAKLVQYLAMCLAKVIDDVEIGHGIAVKAAEVYRVVGAEVLQRGAGHVAIPATFTGDEVAPETAAHRKERGLADLAAADQRLVEAERLKGPGDITVEEMHAMINPNASER